MRKFLEYDINSGQVISVITCENPPEPSNGLGLFEIDLNMNIDTSVYAVRDNQLVKLYETNAERAQREKLRKEYAEGVRKRLKSMIYEFVVALLDDMNFIPEICINQG